jgi:hypothetical protein
MVGDKVVMKYALLALLALGCSQEDRIIYGRFGSTSCGVDAAGTGGAGTGGAPGTGGVGAAVSDSFCGDAINVGPLTIATLVDRSPSAQFLSGGAFCQEVAFAAPSTVYLAISHLSQPKGICRSLDSGVHWQRIGPPELDAPIGIRVDPANSKHVYVVHGVNGTPSAHGFWEASDVDGSWVHRPLPAAVNSDAYHVAVDPSDFKHVLVSFHYYYPGNAASGVVESFDGGVTWAVHPPIPGTMTGHMVEFLSNPAKGIGNSQTWLLGVQDTGVDATRGFWRTSNSGTSWSHVATWSGGPEVEMAHGGGEVHYSASGDLYVGGWYAPIRSTDNGLTWSRLSMPFGYWWAFGGDGASLFTSGYGAGGHLMVASESAPTVWSNYNSQVIPGGAFQFAYDGSSSTLYAAQWFSGSGLFALKTQ